MKDKTKQIEQFNSLPMDKKGNLVDCYGHWIWYLDFKNFRISIFELEGEVVEVWYNMVSHKINRIRIPSYKDLDLYLSYIKLPLIRNK